MKTKTLKLTLTVTYNPGKESVQTLNNLLHDLVSHAAGNGLLTGETTATVNNFEASVVEVATGKKKKVRQHVMSNADFPRCIYCGADHDDAFVGGEDCILREV